MTILKAFPDYDGDNTDTMNQQQYQQYLESIKAEVITRFSQLVTVGNISFGPGSTGMPVVKVQGEITGKVAEHFANRHIAVEPFTLSEYQAQLENIAQAG